MIPEIKIEKNTHTRFRVESELKSDAKGGYIRGKILLPCELVGIYGFKLALYDIHDKHHTNLLFVTPFTRQIYGQNASKKDLGITPDSYYISVIYKNGTYIIDHKNHPYLTSLAQKNEPIVGPQFWNPQRNEFILGPEGLRLTVLKPLMKGNNSKITESKMRFLRGVSKDYNIDNTKVKLGLMIDFDFKFLPGADKVFFSNVIEDTAEYDLLIADSSTKAICDNGKFLLKVDLKKGRLTKTKISHLELKLIDEYDQGNEYLTATDYKIISQKDVQFYVPETYPLYDFQTNLKIKLFVHYKDGTPPKIFVKEKYMKLMKHSETSCHCDLQSESVETFLRENPKLKEQSRFLKRKFIDNVGNENFADIDQYIHSNAVNTMVDDLDDIIPSFSPSKVEFFDCDDEKIGDFKMSSSTYITIKVTNIDKNIIKNQSKIDINSDGSIRISDQVEYAKLVDDGVKTAKFGPPIDTPILFALEGFQKTGDGPSSKPKNVGSVNAISWKRTPTSKPRLVHDLRNFPEELVGKNFKIDSLKEPIVEIHHHADTNDTGISSSLSKYIAIYVLIMIYEELILSFKISETESLTISSMNCLEVVDEDENSSQKSNSVHPTSDDDTGNRRRLHCSEKRGLCSIKRSSKTFQNLLYFWNMKTHVCFQFSLTCYYFVFSPK